MGEAPKWTVEGGSPTYLGLEVPISLPAITGFELIVMATAESLRAEEKDPVKRCYPGGGLDFLNLSNTDEKKLRGLKTRDLAALPRLRPPDLPGRLGPTRRGAAPRELRNR